METTGAKPFEKIYYAYTCEGLPYMSRLPIRVYNTYSLNPSRGKQERDKATNKTAVFFLGEYKCTDPEIASYLDVYHDGGEYTINGRKETKSPNPFFAFRISSEYIPPAGTKTVEKVVQKFVIPEFILVDMDLKQLKESADKLGIKYSEFITKEGLVDLFRKNGNVA